MQLKIITPDKGIEINKEVVLVAAEGTEGNFGILDGHLDFISSLKPISTLRYQTKSDNPMHEVKLSAGLLEVSRTVNNKTEVKVIASTIL